MRLNCIVERRNRDHLNVRGKRPAASVLSIGRKTSGVDIVIAHQFVSNGETSTYKVRGNILHVFSKFVEDGKTTLSFVAPPHDLLIRADDVIQLKSFLNCLRRALQGKEMSQGAGGLSSLDSNVKARRPRTKLIITSKCNYPTLEGFERTLVELHISGIDQSKFDNRILKLHRLRVLDLSKNKLKILPRDVGDMPNLGELYLSNNDLGESSHQLGAWDWLRGSKLPKSLNVLDLSSNNISALPSFLREYSALESLKLNSNRLTILPSGIGKMNGLRYLTLSNNMLKFLPGSMKENNFSHLDVSHNPFTGDCLVTDTRVLEPLTLKELAARSVIAFRIPVSEAIIPLTVLRFLQGCDFCMCGWACFNPASSKIVYMDVRKLSRNLNGNTVLGPGESVFKPFRVSYCVDRCIAKD